MLTGHQDPTTLEYLDGLFDRGSFEEVCEFSNTCNLMFFFNTLSLWISFSFHLLFSLEMIL